MILSWFLIWLLDITRLQDSRTLNVKERYDYVVWRSTFLYIIGILLLIIVENDFIIGFYIVQETLIFKLENTEKMTYMDYICHLQFHVFFFLLALYLTLPSLFLIMILAESYNNPFPIHVVLILVFLCVLQHFVSLFGNVLLFLFCLTHFIFFAFIIKKRLVFCHLLMLVYMLGEIILHVVNLVQVPQDEKFVESSL